MIKDIFIQGFPEKSYALSQLAGVKIKRFALIQKLIITDLLLEIVLD